MRNRMIYDTDRVFQKHQQIATWMGPVWCGMVNRARFNDAVGDQPPAADSLPAPDAPPAAAAADLLTDPPAAPASPPAAAAAVQGSLLSVAGLVNADGTFVADWHNSDTLPEELRGNESLGLIKNLSDLAKATVHAKSMVGKNKIALPGDKASDTEIAAFWESVASANPSMARPATAAEYKVEIPEDMAEVFTDARMEVTKRIAHDIGLTKGQFEAYMTHEVSSVKESMANEEAEAERRHDENVLALKKEWGEAYPERQHVVKRLISEAFGSDKEAELNFLQNYAGDPDFVRFAAVIGSRMVESKALVAELTQQTPSDALRKMDELRATPGYMTLGGDLTETQRNDITAEIRELYQQAYPEQKTG